MLRLALPLLGVLLGVAEVSADYPCVCNYGTDIPALAGPDPQSPVLGHIANKYECKPRYEGYTGTDYVAVQIGGKIGYIDVHEQIKQQNCSGTASPGHLLPMSSTTSSTPTPTTVLTTPTTIATSAPTTISKTSTTISTYAHTTFSIPVPTTISTTPTTPTTISTHMETSISTAPSISSTSALTTISATPTTSSTLVTGAYHVVRADKWLYHFNSVLKYIGISYNLPNGNPLVGTGTPSLTDPGLLLGNQVFQLNEYPNGTSREVEVTDLNSTCTTFYSLINNGKSYQEELSTFVRPTADHPQELLDASFIFNKEFNQIRAFTENPQTTNLYKDEVTLCSLRKLRLKDEMTDRKPFSITRNFAKDACDLPVAYDVTEYVDFLDKWGTSIVVEAILGRKELKRFQTTEQTIYKVAEEKNSSLLHHAGAFKNYASSLTLSRQDYVNQVAQTADLGSSSTVTLMDSRHGDLVPVGLKLVPITFAFYWKYWKDVITQYQTTGVCGHGITMATIQYIAENINRTLSRYFIEKNTMSGLNLKPLTDSDLQMPVTWPKGTYGLMKPKNGCPMGHVTWHEGWRAQDSYTHINVNHHFSLGISNTLEGTFNDRIKTYYCMKTDATSSAYDRDWPKGNYCILKKGNCPTGFISGSIYWDDFDFLNHNSKGGTLPDGTYNSNTKIFYCCRDDGPISNPITLPVDRPFVLLRYNGACQQVYSMSMRGVFIEWATADVNNHDSLSGAHPMDEIGRNLKGHKLHFCFYYFNTGGVIIG